MVQKNWQRAARLFEQASRVKPEDVQSTMLLGLACRTLGLTERAESTYREALERGHRHVELNPDDARALYLVAQCHVELGEREKGLDWGRRARALGPDDPYVLYGVVCLFAGLGERDEAAVYFEQAVRAGFRNRRWIEMDPDLDSIRDHPRYKKTLATLGNDAPPA
jgi:tetratricopeptide (TPR) repeat protein